MARARATEPRSRSKTALLEEIGRALGQFQDILTSIEDFSREGFPYQEAARAKAELQFRECVRRHFGERSPEFQTYRQYRLRTTTQEDTAQSMEVVKSVMAALEEKKLEYQGAKPAAKHANTAESSPTAAPPSKTPVPPPNGAAQQPAPVSPSPMTVSVAFTTNLASSTTSVSAAVPATDSPAASTPPPSPAAPNAAPPQPVPAPPTPMADSNAPAGTPARTKETERTSRPQPAAPAVSVAASPTAQNQPPSPTPVEHPAPEVAPVPPTHLHAAPPTPVTGTDIDPLEVLRKVCGRFHAVTRQLRLRKDYRATLEVEDDYDLQDLFCALLKVEFDEVGTDEWTPPYADNAPRTAFLLHGDQIAVVVKKTRSGLTTKELADQFDTDSARYAARERCTILFGFIYDPEGRIGSPKRLETDLTSVSDRFMTEVLVAPK